MEKHLNEIMSVIGRYILHKDDLQLKEDIREIMATYGAEEYEDGYDEGYGYDRDY